ncbi:MAG: NADH-quinone oxidoreductase subunit E [Prevotellaceae bacterium]|jgi:formate hydrogenlyase subunit 3/multisubunit Na+/H+ antiporter MnhD subunit|nr:NADH-quinone oxidoreductase subunit E [Prevotellaceae bacterium]
MLLTPLVFFVKSKGKYFYIATLIFSSVAISGYMALSSLLGGEIIQQRISILFFGNSVIALDKLSAFFILLVDVAIVVAIWYSYGYLKYHLTNKSSQQASLHYFSYALLYFSMIFALVLRDGYSFLLAWELMTIASFILVILDGQERKKLKAAISYLVQMHIGFFMFLAAFMLLKKSTGEMSFDALGSYFSSNPNFGLFLLFFLGFGMKAGFVPLHTWLPEVHPTAPGNVSGFMSGAIIKMGLYGLVRVISHLQADFFTISVFLLIVSIITGLFGICLAIVQKDIKRLLAYSSIENMGIIGIGLSLAILGKAYGNDLLTVYGFTGALLHAFNHSVFKSLLFFSAGSLSKATGTQNMELMGGAVKRMPYTSLFFLIGSVAICALPPFNGFISEFIIYSGAFDSLSGSSVGAVALLMSAIVSLALIGGLSIIVFSKAFGIAFLGEPRSRKAQATKEVGKSMLQPLIISSILIVAIGLFSMVFVRPLGDIAGECLKINYTNAFYETQGIAAVLSKVGLVCAIFIATVVLLYFIRKAIIARRTVKYGPTWGCGYTAPDSRQQYTSSSYVSDFAHLVNPVTRYKRDMKPIAEDEIFPVRRTFKGKEHDVLNSTLINKPLRWMNKWFFRLAIFQTGKIQHYILYALLFMILIFALSYFDTL